MISRKKLSLSFFCLETVNGLKPSKLRLIRFFSSTVKRTATSPFKQLKGVDAGDETLPTFFPIDIADAVRALRTLVREDRLERGTDNVAFLLAMKFYKPAFDFLLILQPICHCCHGEQISLYLKYAFIGRIEGVGSEAWRPEPGRGLRLEKGSSNQRQACRCRRSVNVVAYDLRHVRLLRTGT